MNLKNLSLRSSNDMAAKQAVLAVKVADLEPADLAVAEKEVQVAEKAADGVVLAVRVLAVVQAATDLDDLILTHNHKPSE
jgi:citrate lyase gamma subunit